VDQYGADALRFTLTAMSGQGRDIRLSKPRIEGYRNFGTKLWNAARFCQMNGCVPVEGFDPASATQTVNRWVRGETLKAVREVSAAIDSCAFDDAANALYRFIWNQFCDWYVEFAKPILNGEDVAARDETRAMAAWALDVILKLLHPVSPYITEELWAQTAPEGRPREGLLISAAWPDLPDSFADPASEAEIGLVIAAVTEGRSVRAELNVPPGARPDLFVSEATPAQRQALEANGAVLAHTLRIGALSFDRAAPDGSVAFVAGGVTLALDVRSVIDLPTERARLTKEIATHGADIDRTAKKLANADFIGRAPPEVVAENRERLATAEQTRGRLQAILAKLEGVV
jgi:valyl-tRNA synthetase